MHSIPSSNLVLIEIEENEHEWQQFLADPFSSPQLLLGLDSAFRVLQKRSILRNHILTEDPVFSKLCQVTADNVDTISKNIHSDITTLLTNTGSAAYDDLSLRVARIAGSVYNFILTYGNQTQREIMMNSLLQHMEILPFLRIKPENLREIFSRVSETSTLERLYEQLDSLPRRASDTLIEFFDDFANASFDERKQNGNLKLFNIEMQFARAYLTQYPYDANKLTSIWEHNAEFEVEKDQETYDRYVVESVLYANIDTLRQIERERPKSQYGEEGKSVSEILMRENGIVNFGRIPVNLLIRQFDERREAKPARQVAQDVFPIRKMVTSKFPFLKKYIKTHDLHYGSEKYFKALHPYVLVTLPRFDENGAFYMNFSVYKSLADELQTVGWTIKFIEAENINHLTGLMNRIARQYGRIKTAIIGGHGGGNGIHIGANDFHKNITHHMIQNKIFTKIAQIFDDYPQVIFDACSPAVEDGIAQSISETHPHATFSGAGVPITLGNISVEQINGTILLHPEFVAKNELDEPIPTPTIAYQAGKRIENEAIFEEILSQSTVPLENIE